MATDIIKTITRIDPAEGLVQYVNAVKPFHTKILDVAIEYVYDEPVAVGVVDRLILEVGLNIPDFETVMSCGYGIEWDPFINPTSRILSPVNILSATGCVAEDDNSCSFLVGTLPTAATFSYVVVSPESNQLAFSKNYTITSADIANNRWVVSDSTIQLPLELSAGKKFFVSTNSGNGNGEYTVVSVMASAGSSYVTVSETIPSLAANDGIFHRLLTSTEVPSWQLGTAIKFAGAGTQPTGINTTVQYYYSPINHVGRFQIGKIRFPSSFDDMVDLLTSGSGALTVMRTEHFRPGMSVTLTGSQSGTNDGIYTVREVVRSGSNERVFVMEPVPVTNPAPLGQLTFRQPGFDEPTFCTPLAMSALRADTFIHEQLTMVFD